MLLDTEGFAIPFTDDDAVIEAGCDDPDYGEPEGWPEWTDGDCWAPTAADEAWLAAQNADADDWPADAEWSRHIEEIAEASRWQDQVEAMHWSDGDDDLRAAGLPAG
jgi:hypothetical protein